jgi:hypothetical protein
MAEKPDPHSKPPNEPSVEGSEKKSTSSGSGATVQPDLVAFTIDANAGRIVKVEKVDNTGARRELSDEDAARLTNANTVPTLEAIIEQVFEAGIACVLGDDAAPDEAHESEEDGDLIRLLLLPLMERTSAHSLKQHGLLGRAIIASAIEQTRGYRQTKVSRQPRGPTAKSRPPTQPGSARE